MASRRGRCRAPRRARRCRRGGPRNGHGRHGSPAAGFTLADLEARRGRGPRREPQTQGASEGPQSGPWIVARRAAPRRSRPNLRNRPATLSNRVRYIAYHILISVIFVSHWLPPSLPWRRLRGSDIAGPPHEVTGARQTPPFGAGKAIPRTPQASLAAAGPGRGMTRRAQTVPFPSLLASNRRAAAMKRARGHRVAACGEPTRSGCPARPHRTVRNGAGAHRPRNGTGAGPGT